MYSTYSQCQSLNLSLPTQYSLCKTLYYTKPVNIMNNVTATKFIKIQIEIQTSATFSCVQIQGFDVAQDREEVDRIFKSESALPKVQDICT